MFSTLQEVEIFFKKRNELGVKPGLERIHKLLELLGNPEREMNAIHIAGTNGKGSTLFFLASTLRANNYNVGVFTSPSFHGLRGHILLNDQPIGEEDWIQLLNQAYPLIKEMDEEKMAPTTFEIITALAFSYFKNHGDIILVETGMGGRYDTTNCFHPILSIITNISLDHTDYLGNTVEKVAYHKAGIIKKNSPVIVGEMDKSAFSVLLKTASQVSAPIYQLGRDFIIEDVDDYFLWKSEDKSLPVHLTMKGEHQRKNAALSLKALQLIEEKGWSINWIKALTAIEEKELLGRFEVVHENPTIIVDAAHNPAAMKTFIKTIQTQFSSNKKHVTVAMFQDKATEEMLELLRGYFNEMTLTTFAHPRAWDPHKVREDILLEDNIEIEPDYKAILHRSFDVNKVYFFTGSLHFIMLIRNFFQEESGIL